MRAKRGDSSDDNLCVKLCDVTSRDSEDVMGKRKDAKVGEECVVFFITALRDS